jgi:hypothetical protein
MTSEATNRPTGAGRYLFEDAPPPPPHLAALARPFVDRAVLKFKNFRVDLEKVQGAAVKAMQDGLVSKDDATLIWLDVGNVTSVPLVHRYCDARHHDLVAAWIRAREAFPCAGWLKGYVQVALDRFVADGVGEQAASLALAHAERAMKSLRLDWKERRRGIPKKLPPETQEVMRGMQRALIARIPLRNADMLLELGELLPYLAHGTREERAALAALAEEVKADQERFPAT